MKSRTAGTYHSLYHRSLLIIALLGAVGCTSVARMYPGPALPQDKVARLSYADPIVVLTVDGKKSPLVFGVLELLPGSHAVTVEYVICNYKEGQCYHSDNSIALTFDAKEGGSYTIGHSREGNAWNAWIIDEKEKKDTSRK